MQEAKADRQKLQNMNKQQATYIKNLEAMQKELQTKVEDLKNQVTSAKKNQGRKSGSKGQGTWANNKSLNHSGLKSEVSQNSKNLF